MEYSLRRAVRTDAKMIRVMIWRAGINPTGLDWRRFWVAVDAGGQIIGCGQIKPHRDGSRELASIAVAPEWQRRGVARSIIGQLLDGQSPPLYLTCRASLESFYNRFGFTTITNPDNMPGYFRLVWSVFYLVRRLFRKQEGLLVMHWNGDLFGK